MEQYLREQGYERSSHTHQPLKALFEKMAEQGDEDCQNLSEHRMTENVEQYTKVFNDQFWIRVSMHTNFYGGKTVIDVGVQYAHDPPRMRSPDLSFFATGLRDFPAFEKRVLEEIAPKLREWAINEL